MIATPTEISNFVETYQTRHISKASIRLGVAQPTLTQSLQKLEDKIGSKLFFRTKQGVVPTEEGNLFYARARQLLDAWQGIGSEIVSVRTQLQGRFRIGCHTSVALYTLPKLFENLGKAAPRIQIELIHDFSRKITEQVISYGLDLGYVVNPIRHPDLVIKRLGGDFIGFWKKKGQANTPQRLFVDGNLKQVEHLLAKTVGKEFKSWDIVQTSSLEVARELTLNGHGVAALPRRVAELAQPELTLFHKSLPIFHDEVCLVYRKEVLSSAAGKELVRLATLNLGNLGNSGNSGSSGHSRTLMA